MGPADGHKFAFLTVGDGATPLLECARHARVVSGTLVTSAGVNLPPPPPPENTSGRRAFKRWPILVVVALGGVAAGVLLAWSSNLRDQETSVSSTVNSSQPESKASPSADEPTTTVATVESPDPALTEFAELVRLITLSEEVIIEYIDETALSEDGFFLAVEGAIDAAGVEDGSDAMARILRDAVVGYWGSELFRYAVELGNYLSDQNFAADDLQSLRFSDSPLGEEVEAIRRLYLDHVYAWEDYADAYGLVIDHYRAGWSEAAIGPPLSDLKDRQLQSEDRAISDTWNQFCRELGRFRTSYDVDDEVAEQARQICAL